MWGVIAVLIISFYTVRWLLRKLTVGQYGERYVFITGCDSGFGNLLAKQLDKLGCNVFAGCFTEKGSIELKKTSSSRLLTIDLDVTNETSIKNAVKFVKSSLPKGKGLWGLVNNAGITGTVGLIEWLKKQDYIDALDVNLLGMIEVTRALLPLLRRGKGRVVNTSSMMGRIAAAPAPYSITKYAVEAYSDCLRRQVGRTGVSVHIIEPGYFRTPILNNDAINSSIRRSFDRADPDVKSFYGEGIVDEMQEHATKMIASVASLDTYLVADAYTHALTARFPKSRYLVGWDANYIFRTLWNLPTWLSDAILTSLDPVSAMVKQSR